MGKNQWIVAYPLPTLEFVRHLFGIFYLSNESWTNNFALVLKKPCLKYSGKAYLIYVIVILFCAIHSFIFMNNGTNRAAITIPFNALKGKIPAITVTHFT